MCYNVRVEQRTSREISNANLKIWQPGESGNSKGRLPGSVTTLLKEKDRQQIADKLYDMAINGEMAAIREYLDRTEGKVPTSFDPGEGAAIVLQFIPAKQIGEGNATE